MKPTKETWIRTMVLILCLINQILIACKLNPLPFSEAQYYEGASAVITAAVSLWNWWKNNSFTKAAIRADSYLKELKEQGDEI